MKNKEQTQAISIGLQELANIIDAFFEEKAGERLGWVLVVSANDVAQYVGNVKRAEGKELLESLLTRWKAGRADIPAHYNPNLKP